MHLKRWITGIIAIPILIYIIGFAPRWVFSILLFLASLAGLIEFYGITSPELPRPIRVWNYGLTLMIFVTYYTRQVLLAPAIIILWAFFPMAFFMFTRGPEGRWTADIGKALLGPVYLALPLGLLFLIDLQPKGNLWIFFLLVVIFASDTGAFYFGKYFGKHKLYKAISPGKTWEGAVGGVFCSLIAALWFLRIMSLHKIDVLIIMLVISLSVAGQIGDLAESMLKRNHCVKDSGGILPGHGGILDRIDGLLFAIPLLYFFLNWHIR